jgi:ribonuclease P protein component
LSQAQGRSDLPHLVVLRRRAEFLAAAQSGKKWVAPGLIVQMFATPPQSDTTPLLRYGLTASGKIGNAVKRNRARRRLRALAHEILPLHAAAGHDFVLIARGAIILRDYGELRNDLRMALKKLGVYREP